MFVPRLNLMHNKMTQAPKKAESEKHLHIRGHRISLRLISFSSCQKKKGRNKKGLCISAVERVGQGTVGNANNCHFGDKGTCVRHVGSGRYHAYHASKSFLWKDSKGNSTYKRAELGRPGAQRSDMHTTRLFSCQGPQRSLGPLPPRMPNQSRRLITDIWNQ